MKKTLKYRGLFMISLCAVSMNFFLINKVFGQDPGAQPSRVEIVVPSGSLTLNSVPDDINFGSSMTAGEFTPVFSDTGTTLPLNRRLTVADTRENGGFLVTVSIDDDFKTPRGDRLLLTTTNHTKTFKLMTSSQVNSLSGAEHNGVLYEANTDPSSVVTAPLNVMNHNQPFNQPATFDIDNLSNALTKAEPTLNVLNGQTGDHFGTYTVGVAFMLKIPPYQIPGNYSATITWTLIQ